jgi:quercetin dioxygenase-like cupin family protein
MPVANSSRRRVRREYEQEIEKTGRAHGVPAHTTIPAHSHRDDRMATVVSGTREFGYGDRFDEVALKILPAGSVYSEPGHTNHFARSGDEPVLVQISGFGPTDTQYVNSAVAPRPADR